MLWGDWIQIGNDIDGEGADDNFGYSVSLSADGKVLAVGGQGNANNGIRSGQVRVFGLEGEDWMQIGQDIDGEANRDFFGFSVSISDDGTAVASGGDFAGGENKRNAGHVRVFGLDGDHWTQIGRNIEGENANDRFGFSVSLSFDGKTVAAGAIDNDFNGFQAGSVRVFGLEGEDWTQIGQNMNGEAETNFFGRSVSLSNDGTVVAVGAPRNQASGYLAGSVRVFRLVEGNWAQIGQELDAKAEREMFGLSVSMSADGTIVAAGAPDNVCVCEYVRVYQLDEWAGRFDSLKSFWLWDFDFFHLLWMVVRGRIQCIGSEQVYPW
jgi:hypothetical protein